jgi:hypothetical protein
VTDRRISVLAVLALVGLSACTSVPSTRTVAEEIIQTLEGVSQDVKDCMAERLENNYTDDDLETIGEANPGFNSANPDVPQTPELEAFIADLAECTENPTSGEPSDDTTDVTATTEG